MSALAMKTSTLDVFVYVCAMGKHRPVLIKINDICAIAQNTLQYVVKFQKYDTYVAISIGNITQKALKPVSNDSFYEKQSMPPQSKYPIALENRKKTD
jgi:hypothetical protein